MSMLIVSDTKSLNNKETNVLTINASILNRKNRKYWYIKYQVLFENGDVKKAEFSTKVMKSEKTLHYMKSKFLPTWLSKNRENLSIQEQKSKMFDYYASLFIEDYKKWHDYKIVKYRFNRILKDFKSLEITKITKLQVKQWLLSLKDSQTNKDITRNTRIKYLRVFHGIFELALDNNVIPKNFTFEIKFDKERRDLTRVKPFEANEVHILLERSKDPMYSKLLHNYLGIAFNQGMSPSEILGLQIKDIDLDKQVISIKRNVTKGKIKETKTIYRDRDIPMFNSSINYFQKLINEANKKSSIWLFSMDDGTYIKDVQYIRGTRQLEANNKIVKYQTQWYKLLADCNIEYRDLKNCRHTFAVSAIESKAFSMQEIANILGHGSLRMLLEHYAKWIGDKALNADKSIDLFCGTLGDTSKVSQNL